MIRQGLEVITGSAVRFPEGVRVGNAQDIEGATGCTVILAPSGATCSVAVHGGAPATRETDLLAPEKMVQEVHAVVLSGGSAFGLEACDGVSGYLAQQGIGIDFGGYTVPVVCGASLFDLGCGSHDVYPDAAMGHKACAESGFSLSPGNHGAGCGATVGKLLGPTLAMKGGLGVAGATVHGAEICAVVAVNSLGNVRDGAMSMELAGVRDPSGKAAIIDPYRAFEQLLQMPDNPFGVSGAGADGSGSGAVLSNTTIGCIVTDAALSKAACRQIATMVHDAYARTIVPAHTSNDGDAVFVMATGAVPLHADVVGAYATVIMERAVHNAVLSAHSAYGYVASRDIIGGLDA